MSTEIYQDYGNDLVLDKGDLAIASDELLSNQRIVRRLLTVPIEVFNPPDYLDHPTYGAGLGKFIGKNATTDVVNEIKGIITAQMYLEPTVGKNPAPKIEIAGLPNQLNCRIEYTNLLIDKQAVVQFSVP
jgi:hypothetical protein